MTEGWATEQENSMHQEAKPGSVGGSEGKTFIFDLCSVDTYDEYGSEQVSIRVAFEFCDLVLSTLSCRKSKTDAPTTFSFG
jgi:hypothetical protein